MRSCLWEQEQKLLLTAQAQPDRALRWLLQQPRRKSIHTQRMSFVRDRYFPRDSVEYVQQEQKLFQGASCLLHHARQGVLPTVPRAELPSSLCQVADNVCLWLAVHAWQLAITA